MSSAAEPVPSVVVSEELFAPVSPGIELCYQTFGDPGDDPLLLVMGLGGPMNWWHPDLCSLLAARGFFVVRFDNRDVGRSTKIGGRVKRSALVRAFAGRGGRPPYTLTDMAHDAFGLLDHLGIQAAHVVGVSMGGMIVQTMAVEKPERIRSLTSIMSTSGKRSVGWQHPKLLPILLAPRGPGRKAYAETSARLWQMIGSPAYPTDHEEILARAEETWDRGFSANGVMRQMLAILNQPNRSLRLRSLTMPTLVVHGLSDHMVHVSGGRATAAAIPGAELLLVEGMGHDLPRALWGTFVDAIRHTADRATR
ncbi:MAG TPA: alpha/beta hydrolase [Nocardioides sp.]|uniref:alpha/beta fold hydrolase n=1 Tax=Nocardioides sp. TaxID=35761 RepID=UPI002C6F6D7B|nr:alpha/beta hydrolase [Nocardioides sp.]HQR26121.1 alpha/beta hydrolase [Nocardioides sp.]